MSELEQQLEGVELTIEDAKRKIELGQALQRLEKNKDFKVLILDNLLKDDAIRQVRLLAAPGLKAPGDGPAVARAGVMARIDMIGELTNFFRWTHQEAAQSKAALEDHEETRQQILAEQLMEA
jgi:hypothetical protein